MLLPARAEVDELCFKARAYPANHYVDNMFCCGSYLSHACSKQSAFGTDDAMSNLFGCARPVNIGWSAGIYGSGEPCGQQQKHAIS